MTFLEKSLEDIIFETPNEFLRQRGLPIKGKKFRQVRIGNYGIADIITIERRPHFFKCQGQDMIEYFLTITIYELKKDTIDIQALGQGCRYIKGIDEWFEHSNKFQHDNIDFSVCLIGSKVSLNGDFVYVADLLDEKCDLYEYSYNYDGLKFKLQHGYKLTNNGF